MKGFATRSPRGVSEAVRLLTDARTSGRHAAIAGGGSDLLGMVKERLIAPDTIVRLAAIERLDRVTHASSGVSVGGQITLDALQRNAEIRRSYAVLAEAAASVATPQIRNVATLAGNVCQRPWCWYYRNGFSCLKNGGSVCYSAAGENHFHAIFGGGPSFIVHPSDTAPALVALDARFRIAGPQGEREVPAADFFTLPSVNAATENVLREDELLAAIDLPAPAATARSRYHKILDREAWTHAVVSAAIVLDLGEGGICRSARVVLGGVAPIPWRLPEVERLLSGQPITEALAAAAGDAAVAGARALQHNRYKIPLTRAMVARTLIELAAG